MNTRIFLFALLVFGTVTAHADPRIGSWFTDRTGVYARIYETTADETAQNAVTTWNRGAGVQSQPTYAGIHEVSFTPDWVYIRTTNLASYIMGPWYLNAAKTNLFPNYPSNRAVLYRIPRAPTIPATKTLTGLGSIGYFVNGVAMFDTRDAFSYSTTTMNDQQGAGGDGAWNRDAWVNESVTFDAGNAHQAMNNHHYHANPPGLRHQLGDSVDYTAATNTYTENFNGNHSPIISWARDGLPIYGPYGYSDPNNAASLITRMRSGYQIRAGLVNRTSWPTWATNVYAGTGVTFSNGPAVSGAFPLGRYMEDNEYKGDVGMTLGVDFDLNEQNARFCVTPDFPGGTWAYFTCIDAAGNPEFPYNIGRAFQGNPTGNTVGAIPGPGDAGPATTHFEGGPEIFPTVESTSIDDPGADDFTVIWNAAEGGTYEVSHSADIGQSNWTVLAPQVTAQSDKAGITHAGIVSTVDLNTYRVQPISLAPFDDIGFDYDENVLVNVGGNETLTLGGGVQTLFIHLNPMDVPGAPAYMGTLPTSILIGGQAATFVRRISRYVLEVSIDPDAAGLGSGTHGMTVDFGGGALTALNSAVIPGGGGPNDILILIVDDWGIDRSPIDNTLSVPLPNMPNLATLAAGGLRFTRAYVNPACSPTRASLMTGRYAHQTGVYTPQDSGDFSNTINELTLPEAMTAAGSSYAMGSQGKWHLGGGVTGFSVRGGWDDFRGITGGGVNPTYTDWTKNNNGTDIPNYSVYSTTDQVDEAITFINTSDTAGDPWLCWVAFNAPHDPFHDPPAGLAPPGGYSAQAPGENANRWNYRKMLEALDTEMGRLLAAIDQNTTNIILIGDNGTPNQTVQAPFGPEGAGGAAHGKGDLYNGGIHVPMVFKGPAYTGAANATTDKLVHAVDLYTTILELAGINPATVPGMPATALSQSTSIVPILTGTDTADRCLIAEGGAGAARGRAIILDDHPTYKMIIFGDPESTADTPMVEFYANITTTDQNELSPLYNGVHPNNPSYAGNGLSGTDSTAFDACIAKDATLGGGYSDNPVVVGDTLYLELPNITGPASPPNNLNALPTSITIDDGTATNQTASLVGRLDWGTDLADESDDVAARYWVKCTLPSGISGPYSNAVVTFPDNPNTGDPRVFTAIQILVKP